MRAVVFDRYGPPDVLRLVEVPEPELGPGQVLLAVKAVSVNPVDVKIRAGAQAAVNPQRFPARTGLDVSGVVVRVGSGVTDFSSGQAVHASPHHRRGGTWAERFVLRAEECAPVPAGLSHEEAASLPLVGLTAWDCLQAAGLKAGERLLVHGGSGGVGAIAVQLGVARGANVAATCSAANVQFVHSLGAQVAVDYRTERWWERFPEPDVVLDGLGPTSVAEALQRGAATVRVASITSGLPDHVRRSGPLLGALRTAVGMGQLSAGAWLAGKRVHHVLRKPSGDNLRALGQLVEAGRLEPQVGEVLPWQDFRRAHELQEAGSVRGKIVLTLG